jgi:hypothetical protein
MLLAQRLGAGADYNVGMRQYLVIAIAACATQTRFALTDQTYTPSPAQQAPKVYFDRLPETSYRAVGIIAVDVDVLAGRGTIAAAAAEAGQRAGCAVLVERKLHERHGELQLMRVHDEPDKSGDKGGAAIHRVEFICGVAPRVTATRTAW